MRKIIMMFIAIVLLATGTAGALETGEVGRLPAVSWSDGGQVHVAIGNPSSQSIQADIVLGTHLFGLVEMAREQVILEPAAITVASFPVRSCVKGRMGLLSDTVVVERGGEEVSRCLVQGLHPASKTAQANKHVVAEKESVEIEIDANRLFTPDGSKGTVKLKLPELVDIAGQPVELEVAAAGAGKSLIPSYTESKSMYTFGWNGVLLRLSVPPVVGIEVVSFQCETVEQVEEGELMSGFRSPAIMVYGPDIAVIHR